jgi:hypothetical protein
VTSETTPAEPRYGVKTCGEPAPEPAASFLGGCIHTPNHDGEPHRYTPPPIPAGAYIEIEVGEGPGPKRHRMRSPYDDEAAAKYRRRSRNSWWFVIFAAGLNLGIAGYNIIQILTR